jgi:hypothetical protein
VQPLKFQRRSDAIRKPTGLPLVGYRKFPCARRCINPDLLPADHYFFVPQVQLSNGDFLWLSAPRPIVAPGTPCMPDLPTWIRNESLEPDWLRVGTDITPQGPFNGAFSLNGTVARPEPATLLLTGAGLLLFMRSKRK